MVLDKLNSSAFPMKKIIEKRHRHLCLYYFGKDYGDAFFGFYDLT